MNKITLGNLISISKGKQSSRAEVQTTISKRIIQIDDLRNDNNITFTNDHAGVEVFKDDILIAWDGANAGLVGFGKEGFLGSTLAVLRKKDEYAYYSPYLGYYLQHRFKYFQQTSVGATIPHLNRGAIVGLEVPLPEYSEQLRISTLLNTMEQLIEFRKKSLGLLEEFIGATFNKMFGNPITNEMSWQSSSILDIVVDDKNAIRRGPFGGVLKKEIFVPDGYLVYEQYHALNNDFTFERYFIDKEKFEELKAFEVQSGDIIISCSGVYLGKLAIIPENSRRGIINQALLKISLDQNKVNNEFFVHQWSHPDFKKTFYGKNIGSGIPNFPPMEDFKKFNFILPNIELQNEFGAIVKRVKLLKDKISIHLLGLEKLQTSLNQRAFKGELDLAKVTIDENLLPVKLIEISDEVDESLGKKIVLDPLENKSVDIKAKNLKWELISFERLAEFIKERFERSYFNSEMLMHYLTSELVIKVYYHSTAEQKKNPQLAEADDLYSFISGALNGNHQFLQLEQIFYNATTDDIEIFSFNEQNLADLNQSEDKDRSGIYFRIKDEINQS